MLRWLALVLLAPIGACGGHGGGADARNDAVAFADAPVSDTCDYLEVHDDTNAATAETTDLTVGGAGSAGKTICGQVDHGHYADGVVDLATYAVTVPAGGADLVIRIAGQGASDLGQLRVELHDAAGGGYGYGIFVVDHGVMNTHVAAGSYVIAVDAHDAADVDGPIPYHVTIDADIPAARCPRIGAAASHVETDESPAQPPDTADDVVFIAGGVESLTPSTTDAPDDSHVVVTSGMSYRITGTSADVNVAPPGGDDYHDRDTYLISTGADTNELQIRLDWVGPTNDLDFFLFPELQGDGTPADIGAGATTHVEELQTIAVAPSSRYWLWVGGADTSKALPSLYDVSICGTHFTP